MMTPCLTLNELQVCTGGGERRATTDARTSLPLTLSLSLSLSHSPSHSPSHSHSHSPSHSLTLYPGPGQPSVQEPSLTKLCCWQFANGGL